MRDHLIEVMEQIEQGAEGQEEHDVHALWAAFRVERDKYNAKMAAYDKLFKANRLQRWPMWPKVI